MTRFAVIGDYGLSPTDDPTSVQEVANLIKTWSVDFIITVGDNNYLSSSTATYDERVGQFYHEFIGNYKGKYGSGPDPIQVNNFYPALGNSDWGMGNIEAYLNFFDLPKDERYYNFQRGPVEFFALNSNSTEPDGRIATKPDQPESRQAQWLKVQLEASTAPWKLVYFHHAPFVSRGSTQGDKTMRWPYRAWGATAVLSGHNHFYERINRPEDGLYFVNGLGGSEKYAIEEVVTGSAFRYGNDYGAMLVEATYTEIVFKFITRQAEEKDYYRIHQDDISFDGEQKDYQIQVCIERRINCE